MFFHSLAVVGTPLDQTLALKIIYARVFWVPGKAGAHLADDGGMVLWPEMFAELPNVDHIAIQDHPLG